MTSRRRPVVVMIGCETFAVRPGGLNRFYQDLADELEPAWEVRKVLPGDSFRGRTPAPLRLPLRLLGAFWASVRTIVGADVVDSHFALYGLPAVIIARMLRKPIVVHFQGPWSAESEVAGKGRRLAWMIKRYLEMYVYRSATSCVVLSDAFKTQLSEGYAVDLFRISVIRPGVDLERFVPRGSQIPHTAFAARRLDPRMGLDIAVSAWPAVLAAIPGAVLSIAGEGTQRSSLERQIIELDLEGSVILRGRLSDDDLLAGYQCSQISLVPTRALEGFGLVAIEAMACGTPTIVSDVDALPEFMQEFDNTMIVPRSNPPALADRIIRAFNGELPAREDCRRYAETLTWKRAADTHTRLYSMIVGKVDHHLNTPQSVTMFALEWPTSENAGGGVARLNYRIASSLVARGVPLKVVTLQGGADLEGAEIKLVRRKNSRIWRYYIAPLIAARVIGRRPLDTVLALGDDWAMWGVRRTRLYTGSSRSEARTSHGMRAANHWILAWLEIINSLDRRSINWTIGPDTPRSGMRAQHYPPVPDLKVVDDKHLVSGRTGIAFIGPPGGRKRGWLAMRIAGHVRKYGGVLESLVVYTAEESDASFWEGAARVHVALSDDDLAAGLKQQAFLLSTSSYEGFGIPIVEAMANGCVPVVTDTPGARAILKGPLTQLIGPVGEDAFFSFATQVLRSIGSDSAEYSELQTLCLDRAQQIARNADPMRLLVRSV